MLDVHSLTNDGLKALSSAIVLQAYIDYKSLLKKSKSDKLSKTKRANAQKKIDDEYNNFFGSDYLFRLCEIAETEHVNNYNPGEYLKNKAQEEVLAEIG